MHAAWYEQTGPAADVLQVGDLPAPTPGPGEVLVRVLASGVNPSDVKARAGTRGGASAMPYARIVPHSDGAGVIEAVGDGVPPERIGERVWLWNGQWQRAFGTAAELIALPAAQAVSMPESVDALTGASLGIPGLTAAHGVFADGTVAGQSLLIHGGAGTVGYLMVQLARAGGAHVITTVGSEADAVRARAAGAAVALRYDSPSLAEDIRAANHGQPIDRIIDVEFGMNVDVNAEVMRAHGTIVTYGSARMLRPELPFYPLLFKAARLTFALVYLLDDTQRARAIDHLHHALTTGGLRVPVHARYPLDDIAGAHVAVEAGRRQGAVLVEL